MGAEHQNRRAAGYGSLSVARVAPYLLLLLLLPLSLLQFRITAHWLADAIAPPAGMTRQHIRDQASPDFQIFRMAGIAVRNHRAAQDYARPTQRQRVGLRGETWYYPPPTFLITPLATLGGFRLGFAAWTIGLLLIAIGVLRWAGLAWVPIALGLTAPAAIWSFNLGQLGLATGAAFFASLLMIDRQPQRAGALIGALILKPQAALISPFVLLAAKRYRGFAAAAAMVLGLAGLTTLVCGWPVWRAFLTVGMASQRHVLFAPFPAGGQIWGASIFWMLRSFRLSVPISIAGQLLGALGAILWTLRLWRQPGLDKIHRAAITVMLTLFLTPYAYTSDLCGYSLAIAALVWQRRRLELADVILLMWPAACPYVSLLLHIEITPVFILWAAWRARLGAPNRLPDFQPLAA